MTENREPEFPSYIPDQQAVFIGWIADEESEMNGMPAYYIHWRGGLFVGTYNEQDERFSPRYSPGTEGGAMSEQVHKFKTSTPNAELSRIGRALHNAWALHDSDMIGIQQAHVLALHRANFTRSEIAQILNIEPSTVDSHRYDATGKADAAKTFVARVKQIEEKGDSDITQNSDETAPNAH